MYRKINILSFFFLRKPVIEFTSIFIWILRSRFNSVYIYLLNVLFFLATLFSFGISHFFLFLSTILLRPPFFYVFFYQQLRFLMYDVIVHFLYLSHYMNWTLITLLSYLLYSCRQPSENSFAFISFVFRLCSPLTMNFSLIQLQTSNIHFSFSYAFNNDFTCQTFYSL